MVRRDGDLARIFWSGRIGYIGDQQLPSAGADCQIGIPAPNLDIANRSASREGSGENRLSWMPYIVDEQRRAWIRSDIEVVAQCLHVTDRPVGGDRTDDLRTAWI